LWNMKNETFLPQFHTSPLAHTMVLGLVSLASWLAVGSAWPGMRPKARSGNEGDYIGPSCTVGAHNWHPEAGPCPNMEQPPPPTPASGNTHIWPNQFIVDWRFYFVPDDGDVPPYDPLPTTPYNVTTGRTFYFNDEVTGERNMKEEYDEYCIPVFGAPLTPMGRWNKYSCDFLNVCASSLHLSLSLSLSLAPSHHEP
jgi:hypothetical protein